MWCKIQINIALSWSLNAVIKEKYSEVINKMGIIFKSINVNLTLN